MSQSFQELKTMHRQCLNNKAMGTTVCHIGLLMLLCRLRALSVVPNGSTVDSCIIRSSPIPTEQTATRKVVIDLNSAFPQALIRFQACEKLRQLFAFVRSGQCRAPDGSMADSLESARNKDLQPWVFF